MSKVTAPPNVRSAASRWRLQIFAITWIAYAGYYFTRQSFSVAKVGILDDPATGITKAMLGNLDAVYLACYAIGQFVWGTFADRWGPRVVVLGGLAMSAVAATFMGVTTAIFFLVPLMVAQGLAQSTGWSSLCKNVSAFFAVKERGRVLGLWSTNYAFGGLVAAPFLGWWAYSIFDDYRIAFFTGAVVVAIVFVLVFVFQRNSPRDAEASAAPAPRLGLREQYGIALRDPMVRTLGVSYFLLKPARYAILLWGPVIVTERIPGIGKFEAVVIPVAFGVAGLAAPIVAGFVSDRLFGARRVPVSVLSLALLVVVLALFIPLTASRNVWIMLALLAVIGLAVYAADSMISCIAAVDFGTSERAGTSAGFVNGCGSVGAILGGLLPGYLTGTTLFYGFAVCALIAALVLLPHWNRRPVAEVTA
jgi:MFS transporter, OPA family, glycerol-3-phosphate transporter